MDDIVTPGGSGYRVSVQEEAEGYRPNYPQGNTSSVIAEVYASPNRMLDASGAGCLQSGAMDLRFSPPMGPEMMYYRRDGNYRHGNSMHSVDNTFRPTDVRNTPVGFVNPYGIGKGAGTNYIPMSDNREGKGEPAACRFSEAQERESVEHAETERFVIDPPLDRAKRDVIEPALDGASNMIENETKHGRDDKQPSDNAKVVLVDIEETVTFVAEEHNQTDNFKESEKNKVEKGSTKSRDSEKFKVSPKSTGNNKEVKSEYFETGAANKDLNSDVSAEMEAVPVSDSLKIEETETPEKKVKLSVKIKRNTRSNKETFSIDKLETPNSTQDKDKPSYACDQCEKSYGRKDHLRRHIQTVHTDIRPYVCRVCSLGFARRDRLTRHEVKHSGCPQYSCQICDKKFFRKDSLGKHLMTGVGCKQKDEKIFCKCKKSSEETTSENAAE